MENITLELTIEETNFILQALSKHPFESINNLIQKIQTQGSEQVTAAQPEVPEDTESDAG